MLYTQCPDCGTIFRISAQQLRTAVGQVRCGRCGSLFNALSTLSEDPANLPVEYEPTQADRTPPPIPSDGGEPYGTSGPMTPPQATQAEEPPALPSRLRPAANEVTAVLEPTFTAAMRGEPPSDAADHPAEAIQPPPRVKDPRPPAPKRPPFQPDRLAKEYGFEASRRSPTRGLWGFASLVLGVLLVGQILWRQPQLFIRVPWLHAGLSSLCEVVGCQPPQLRDPRRFEALSRDFIQDPRYPGALLVSLTLRNNADFAQPPPSLDIRLYSQQGELAGRRVFDPRDYGTGAAKRLIPVGGEHLINLSLVDPGREVSGFRFELL